MSYIVEHTHAGSWGCALVNKVGGEWKIVDWEGKAWTICVIEQMLIEGKSEAEIAALEQRGSDESVRSALAHFKEKARGRIEEADWIDDLAYGIGIEMPVPPPEPLPNKPKPGEKVPF